MVATMHTVAAMHTALSFAVSAVGLTPWLGLAARVALAVYAAVIAALLASFFGVVGERVPQKKTLGGRSMCACGRVLRAAELVPVAGWARLALLHRSRATCCGTVVPARYGVSELISALAAGLSFGIGGYGLWSWVPSLAVLFCVLAWHVRAGIRLTGNTRTLAERGSASH
jgi:hypothetical protein